MKFTVTAVKRSDNGRGASRRLRRDGKVPGIIYGIGEPEQITLDHHRLQLDLSHEAFSSSVLDLDLDGKKRAVLLREVQTHPVNGNVLHVDFQGISSDVEIAATVPVHYVNSEESPGVKLSHGIFSSMISELHVHCLPKDLPGSITVDVAHLEINHSIHLNEIKAPDGVRFDALGRDENLTMASVLPPQLEQEPEEAAPSVTEESGEEGAEGEETPTQ